MQGPYSAPDIRSRIWFKIILEERKDLPELPPEVVNEIEQHLMFTYNICLTCLRKIPLRLFCFCYLKQHRIIGRVMNTASKNDHITIQQGHWK